MVDMKVAIKNLNMKNPVMVASGTFGYGKEFHNDIFDISKLGAVITKGISLKPKIGNPSPRTIEVQCGMLNSIGLANVGLDVFLSEKLPFLANVGATVVVNVFGSKVEEYAELASKLNGYEDVEALEVNISCPNVSAGGMHFGLDSKLASEVVNAVRKNFSRVVIVKLSPASNILKIAKAVECSGADAVSLINTFPAMAIDVERRTPVLGNGSGGLSGPAIKPIAVKMVYDLFSNISVPIIGIGGIACADDALEFILAGASAVQVGTANFTNPNAAMEIIEGIEYYLKKNNITDIDDIVGKLEDRD